MAFTAQEELWLVTDIFGLPDDGEMVIVTSLSHRPPSIAQSWESTMSIGDCSNLVTKVRTKIHNASAALEADVRLLLEDWPDIRTSPIKLASAAEGDTGNLMDEPVEVETIRSLIAGKFGMWVPPGGFIADANRTYASSYQSSGLGDR